MGQLIIAQAPPNLIHWLHPASNAASAGAAQLLAHCRCCHRVQSSWPRSSTPPAVHPQLLLGRAATHCSPGPCAMPPHHVVRVGCLQRLHVHIRALRCAALVRVRGVQRARVVRRNGGRQLVQQRADVLGLNHLDLRTSGGQVCQSGLVRAGSIDT